MGRQASIELSNNEFNVLDELIRFALSILYPDDEAKWYNKINFYRSVLKIIGGTNPDSISNRLYLKTIALKNGKKPKISESSFSFLCDKVGDALSVLNEKQLSDYRSVRTLFSNFKEKIDKRFKYDCFQLSFNEIREENFKFILTSYLSDRLFESEYERFGTYFFIVFPKIPLDNVCLVRDVHAKKSWVCNTKYFEGILDITYKDDKSDFYFSFQFDCLRNILYDQPKYEGNLVVAGADSLYKLKSVYLDPVKVSFMRQPGKISKEYDFFTALNISSR